MAEKREQTPVQPEAGSDGADKAALTTEVVAEQYRDKIFRHILRLTRDPVEAEDLTQETFLRVHRKLASLQDPATLSTWLYRIATNVCYDRFRQPSYRERGKAMPASSGGDENEQELVDPGAPRLDQIIDRADMANCIREFIERLSDSYRTVLLLHDLHGMTNPEIAEALGCSLATVKIRLHRARLRLKETLAAGCRFSYDERGVFVCERKLPEQD